MIINFPIQCTSCDTTALIKVGIGHQLTHTQKWECEECSILNEFSFDAVPGDIGSSFSLPRYENFRFVNCQLVEANYSEHDFHYSLFFDVDFTAPKRIKDPLSPEASLSRVLRVSQEFNDGNHRDIAPVKRKKLEILFQLFKLFLLKKNDSLEKIARKNKNHIFYERNRNPLYYAFDYLHLQSANIGINLYDIICNEWNSIPEMEKEKIKKFSQKNSIKLNKKIIPVFESYISNLDLFWSVFRRERNGLSSINEEQLVVNFSRVKDVYADCYEVVADYLFIVAAINNYKERQDVSKFERLEGLENYQALDNGSKTNPFKNNSIFSFLNEVYLNRIRNSCNHNDVEIDIDKNVIVFKDKNHHEELTIQEYLLLCHKIISILSCLILFNELYILENN